MTPGDRLVVGIQADIDLLHRGGVVEAVPDVVLAAPLHAHRRADLAREPGRLDGEVSLRLAVEAAAQPGTAHLNVRFPEAAERSDKLRGGKECVVKVRYRGSPEH